MLWLIPCIKAASVHLTHRYVKISVSAAKQLVFDQFAWTKRHVICSTIACSLSHRFPLWNVSQIKRVVLCSLPPSVFISGLFSKFKSSHSLCKILVSNWKKKKKKKTGEGLHTHFLLQVPLLVKHWPFTSADMFLLINSNHCIWCGVSPTLTSSVCHQVLDGHLYTLYARCIYTYISLVYSWVLLFVHANCDSWEEVQECWMISVLT